MPKLARPLTDREIRYNPPGKYADGWGLALTVTPTRRYWTWRGTVQGRRTEYGIGPVALVPPMEAREIALKWSRIARDGGDPRSERDAGKASAVTFKAAAEHVYQRDMTERSEKTRNQWRSTMRIHVFPKIGSKPVSSITRADLEAVLAPIWQTTPTTARRVFQRVSVVLQAAIGKGWYSGPNPCDGDLRKALGAHDKQKRHVRSVPWQELPAVFARIAAADGMGAPALAFATLTAARSGEVRGAVWSEIDLGAAMWEIPAERMKMSRPHRVPLSPAAIELLQSLPRVEGEELVFPGMKPRQPMSDITLAAVLKRLGVDGVPHGMRAAFRSWAEANEVGSHAARELCLAHVNKNEIERAYQRDDLFDARRRIMNIWAEFLNS